MIEQVSVRLPNAFFAFCSNWIHQRIYSCYGAFWATLCSKYGALSNGSIFLLSSFSLLCEIRDISVSSMRFVNAPSSSSSMNCTYPPNSKSSKQRKHNGSSFKQNKHNSTPPVLPSLESAFSWLWMLLPPLWARDAAFICNLYLNFSYSLMCWCVLQTSIWHKFPLIQYHPVLVFNFVCGFCILSVKFICGFLFPSCNFVFVFLPMFVFGLCKFNLHFFMGACNRL